MAEVPGIAPIKTPWPARPKDDDARRRKPPETPAEKREERSGQDQEHDGTDPSIHIDEYA